MDKEIKMQVRFPAVIRDWLRVFAARHNRSMNGQMVAMLREAKEKDEKAQVVA